MAHPDLNQLFNAALPFAQDMLTKHGEFFPFGIALTSDSQLQMFGTSTELAKPPANQVIDLLTKGFRTETAAGKFIAVAICMDIRTVPPGATQKTDAIGIWLEHLTGEAVDVALPYQKSPTGQFQYATLFALPGNHALFTHPPQQ